MPQRLLKEKEFFQWSCFSPQKFCPHLVLVWMSVSRRGWGLRGWFSSWLEGGQDTLLPTVKATPSTLLSSTNSTQSIFTSLIWPLEPLTWSLNDRSSCFCSAFFLAPFNNSHSSTPHSGAPFHCSFDKQQDMKGTGDAEIWPWLQTLLTWEGNNFITTWALIACLGNIQAVPHTEMCGRKRGRKGLLVAAVFLCAFKKYSCISSIISPRIQDRIFAAHFDHFSWKNTINLSKNPFSWSKQKSSCYLFLPSVMFRHHRNCAETPGPWEFYISAYISFTACAQNKFCLQDANV